MLLGMEKQHLSPLTFSVQTGAMFGLDARIALAIFAILAVVAGYIGINATRDASVTGQVTEFQNMKKAYMEFHLATGEQTLEFMDLITNDNNIPGWQGPYIDGMTDNKSRRYGEYSLAEGRQDVPGVPPVECSGGGICATWLKLTKVPDNIAKDIDKALDSIPNASQGTLRVEYVPGSTDTIYYLIGAKEGSTLNGGAGPDVNAGSPLDDSQ